MIFITLPSSNSKSLVCFGSIFIRNLLMLSFDLTNCVTRDWLTHWVISILKSFYWFSIWDNKFTKYNCYNFRDNDSNTYLKKKIYRIYSCISQPFTAKKSAPKIALDFYMSHTQRPDQAVQEISITIAWSA